MVLLKTLRPGADEARRERFAEEVRLASGVEHPNVVRVLRATEDALVAEWVEGADLATVVREAGPLPAALAVALGREVAAGLGAIHRAGIVHRDLNPANVLVGTDGQVRVTDFGLASLAPEAGGEVRGTLSALAPEVVRGETPGPAADLFALGALLAFTLTGHEPFAGRDGSDTLDRVLHADPVPALRSDPRVPDALADVLRSFLAKDPVARPADAREALALLHTTRDATGHADTDDLAAWLDDPATWVPPAPIMPVEEAVDEEVAPALRRRPSRVAFAGLAVLIGILALGWAFWPREAAVERPAATGEPEASPTVAIVPESPDPAPEADPLEAESPPALSPGFPSPALPREADGPNRVQPEASPAEPVRPSVPTPGAPRTAPPQPGTLRISAEPWARVRVDGREVGTTPFAALTLAAGPHEVTFENPEFPAHTVRVEVPSGGEARAAVSLWDLVGRITLDVRPWATVSVDGREWDTVPPQARPLVLTPGAHTLRFEHPALGVREVPLTVSAGEARTVRVRMGAD